MAKILLVEDEKILREAFMMLLEANGFAADAAANGKEALEFWDKSTYDLVLLDLMMPVLDGIGFLKAARPRITAPNTKVIILSNLSSGDILSEALSLGAHGHEVKSNLEPRQLVSFIQRIVG